ncbi:GNAT family N-acetyltransferase [Planotetraspora sp. GP83]|uniref:GNAT family N-acetyltransferase n=1 Tax=Planotetraspora sp. GP83 TaxID=3156264 RepID=UPI0035127EBE
MDGGRHASGGETPPREWARRILTGVAAGYTHLEEGGGGRAVPQGKWLGIYCMAVEPHARRRGLGRSIMRALLGWGRERGAAHAYLVVTEANAGARALYEREGFTVAGRYHYRVGP